MLLVQVICISTYIALIELRVELSLAIMSARICWIPSKTCFTSLIPASIHVHDVLPKIGPQMDDAISSKSILIIMIMILKEESKLIA